MLIDDALISRLEKLARLQLQGGEKQQIREDLNRILAMVDQLSELDLTGVEPLAYVGETSSRSLRPDEKRGQVSRGEALRNAPDADEEYFRVPRVIDK